MRIEDIEIHVGKPDFDYEPIRRLEAKCEATMAFSPAPTVEEMNGKLRSMAAKVGANAIVDVQYHSGVFMTSWKSMKGTGLAVLKSSDERACPACAEKIKRAAVRCRFCGADVGTESTATNNVNEAKPDSSVTDPYSRAPMEMETLRETNNPQVWLIVGAVVIFIFMAIGMAS